MGLALRAEPRPPQPLQRRAAVQTRRHGDAAMPARPMVRATAGIEVTPRPALALVPRRRRATRLVVLACSVVVLAMLGAAAFQTLLAQRQLELDRLDQSIGDAREQYEQLRRERAELRSPGRLADVAAEIGMVPATESRFMDLDPAAVAAVQESLGASEAANAGSRTDDPLAEFGAVKALVGGAP